MILHFSDENIKKLNWMLEKTAWDSIFMKNIDEAFNNFIELFLKCIDGSCPLVVRCNKKSNKASCKNWLNCDLIKEGQELKNSHWLANQLNDFNLIELYKDKKTI
ncbi:hypothetical protein NQ314_000937 [Rhamnusium bicolor]|uniref:Uncharacterized protein n=1 Tax=Rhamnusium bicolor TaxID=1586634 RepID=A0AAV8ZWK7_9CUCU|nr:hypothetical protein NQ314_000937 [Rhamnusium bicolor]